MPSWILTVVLLVVAFGIALAALQWSGLARRRKAHGEFANYNDDYAESMMLQNRLKGFGPL